MRLNQVTDIDCVKRFPFTDGILVCHLKEELL